MEELELSYKLSTVYNCIPSGVTHACTHMPHPLTAKVSRADPDTVQGKPGRVDAGRQHLGAVKQLQYKVLCLASAGDSDQDTLEGVA